MSNYERVRSTDEDVDLVVIDKTSTDPEEEERKVENESGSESESEFESTTAEYPRQKERYSGERAFSYNTIKDQPNKIFNKNGSLVEYRDGFICYDLPTSSAFSAADAVSTALVAGIASYGYGARTAFSIPCSMTYSHKATPERAKVELKELVDLDENFIDATGRRAAHYVMKELYETFSFLQPFVDERAHREQTAKTKKKMRDLRRKKRKERKEAKARAEEEDAAAVDLAAKREAEMKELQAKLEEAEVKKRVAEAETTRIQALMEKMMRAADDK